MLTKIKYFLGKFTFLGIYNSPFKTPKVKLYLGKIRYGTPYFYPRRWVKSKDREGYLVAIPKKIGFDFVDLGWKTKWSDTDYRFEWDPRWSFVFFKWQLCVFFVVPHSSNYWESYLYYKHHTPKKKSKKERVEQCIREFPQVYISHSKEGVEKINYYPLILKTKYHELV